MTIVACGAVSCGYNREAQTPEEKQTAERVCRKEYIVLKTPEQNSCDDYEREDEEDE